MVLAQASMRTESAERERREGDDVGKVATCCCVATKQKATARVALLSKSLSRLEKFWWRFRDSNPGPADYDSVEYSFF